MDILINNKQKLNKAHIVFRLLIGSGIGQQPHAVRVTLRSGQNQSRVSVLRK